LSPHPFSALKIPSSLAILAVIVGDFVGATQGAWLFDDVLFRAS
jgi:ABC-type nitrate/sulfonate/bicarbonate transport system permease component